jgi:predicted enzyme related to lactoylglutathione lyase
MARVTHFDIQVRDIDRAGAFYRKAFGWELYKWDGPMEYWLTTTGDDSKPGINGGIAIGEPNLTEGQLTIDVDSLDDALAKVEAAGGTITQPKGAIPGIGWLAMVKDTEGNVFGLMEDDERAS